jgi:hypothetical protein
MRALSIRQPHAEAILRGVKPVEYRNRRTHIRGRILIYASMGKDSPAEVTVAMAAYGITDCRCEDLPTGVLVGTVELYDCTGQEQDYQLQVRNPERAEELIKPANHPQPSWFFPFERAKMKRTMSLEDLRHA